MSCEVEILSDGAITGKGTIVYVDPKKSFVGVCKDFIISVNGLVEIFQKNFEDDGRIISGERIDISKQLEKVIDLSILLRSKLESSKEDIIFSVSNDKYDYKLNIQMNRLGWSLSGHLGSAKSVRANKFKEWIHGILQKQLKAFLNEVRSATEDGNIDEMEKQKLVSFLDPLILGCILVRNSLLTTLIH